VLKGCDHPWERQWDGRQLGLKMPSLKEKAEAVFFCGGRIEMLVETRQ